MTPLFVRVFEKENKCHKCKLRRLAGHTVCADHLRQARERFAAWSKLRNSAGLCISCNRKGFKIGNHTELRCIVHKNINKRFCKAWMDRMREQTMKTGICARHQHPTVSGLSCQVCQKERAIFSKQRKERRNGTA